MDKYIILGKGRMVCELNQKELTIIKEEIIDFEAKIAKLWNKGLIRFPIHLSGSKKNIQEKQLIRIFNKIKKGDFIFGTHRSHYQYLLAGGSPEKLKKMILDGKSMHIFEKELNFFTSSIVAGCCAIAVGVALALKMKKSKKKVFIFCGDACLDEGNFFEAYRYAVCNKLPITFIIENNNRSVATPIKTRWGKNTLFIKKNKRYLYEYKYDPIYPHVGTRKFITFGKIKLEKNSF